MSRNTSFLSDVKAGGKRSVDSDRTSRNSDKQQHSAEPRDAGNDSNAVIPPDDVTAGVRRNTVASRHGLLLPTGEEINAKNTVQSFAVVCDPVAIAVPQSVTPEPVAYVEPYEPPPANIVEPPQPQIPPEPESYITRLRRQRNMSLLVISIFLIVAAVVGGVCGSGACKSDSGAGTSSVKDIVSTNTTSTKAPVTTNTTTTAPIATNTPATAPTSSPAFDRASAIASFISNITFTGQTLTYPVDGAAGNTTPEELALQWLIDEDPLQFSTDSSAGQFRLQQRYALATLWFQHTDNTRAWTQSTGWSFTDECRWYGLECDQTDFGNETGVQNAVTKISLAENNIRGFIPADLGLLASLKNINIRSNSLSGSLRDTIGQWSNLEVLSISYNTLTGSLPESIGNWTGITRAYFYGNAFTGTLPSSIGQWINLEIFSIGSNALNGSLPESIGNWNFIKLAKFHTNALTGTLPSSIGQWSILEELHFQENELKGPLPESIGNWSQIQLALFNNNAFTGVLPTSIGQWSSVETFRIQENQLNGTLPESIGNWVHIYEAFFYDNAFTGTMPNDVCLAANLTNLVTDCAPTFNCSCCTSCS